MKLQWPSATAGTLVSWLLVALLPGAVPSSHATDDGGRRARLRVAEVDAGAESLGAAERACAAGEGVSAAECDWASHFWTSGLDDGVRALAVHDDGSGEALYAGGFFSSADGVTVGRIARWDGAAWPWHGKGYGPPRS